MRGDMAQPVRRNSVDRMFRIVCRRTFSPARDTIRSTRRRCPGLICSHAFSVRRAGGAPGDRELFVQVPAPQIGTKRAPPDREPAPWRGQVRTADEATRGPSCCSLWRRLCQAPVSGVDGSGDARDRARASRHGSRAAQGAPPDTDHATDCTAPPDRWCRRARRARRTIALGDRDPPWLPRLGADGKNAPGKLGGLAPRA